MDSIRMANEKEIAIRDATLTANKKQKWLLRVGVILLSIIGGLLYYQNQVKKNNNMRLFGLNQELNRANQIKLKFFGILNHDFRSPLSNIISLLQLKQGAPEVLDSETEKRLEGQTLKSAEHLLASMDDLLIWSKGQMENFQPHFDEVSLDKIFKKIEFLFSGMGVELSFSNPEELKIHTDTSYLKTIMRNLTSNSVKAVKGKENAKIHWQAYTDQGRTVLSITDNGKGASHKQFKPLFDDREPIGIKSGMGLHLIRDMARSLGAQLEVDSEPGKGTAIRLIFD